MAGTYEVPLVGSSNESQEPKIKTFIESWNSKLNASNNLEDSGLASPNNSAYRTIISGVGVYGAELEGTRYFASHATLKSSTKVDEELIVFYFAKADLEVAGKTQKLRVRAQQTTNQTAPAVTLTVGMYPVSAISAGSLTVGTVVSGSTVAFASTAANTIAQSNSGDFTIPADGLYIFGVANSGKTATLGSQHSLAFQLQTRSV